MSPLAPADSPPPGQRRWWRVGQNAGALAAARVVSGLCQLALLPVLLRMLGTDTFGWLMALVALIGFSQFADLGVAMAFQQKLSEAWARGDSAGLRRTYAGGAKLLTWLGLAWFVLAAPAAWWLGHLLLHTPSGAGESSARLAWLLIAIAATLGIPLSAGPRLAAAIQTGWMFAGWTAASNLAALLAVWLLARSGGASPLLIVALLCAAQLLPGLLTAWQVQRRLGWRGRFAADSEMVTQLWHAGRKFAAPNLAGALLTAAAPAAVARFGGYGASAAFSIVQRLFGTVQQAHALVLAPFWPAWAEAAGHGEIPWIRHSLRLALGFTAAASAGLAALTLLLPRIVSVWLGAAATVPPSALAWLVALWISAGMFGQALSYFLLGLGRLERVALAIAVAHAGTLLVAVLLGHWLGGVGVVSGLAIGATLGALPCFILASIAAWHDLSRKNSTGATAPVTL